MSTDSEDLRDEDWYDDMDCGPQCPRCGNVETRSRDCSECDEGVVNRYDEDPLWYEDKWVKCHHCNGHGVEVWCPKCGLDLFSKEADRIKKAKLPKPPPPVDPHQTALFT